MKGLIGTRRRRRAATLMALASILGIAAVALFRDRKAPDFEVLPQPFQMPVTFRDRVERRIPRGWSWAWNLESALFGKRRPIAISAEIVFLGAPPRPSADCLALGEPSFSGTNGFKVWLLDTQQLAAARACLKNEAGWESRFRPRIMSAEGLLTAVFTGSSVVIGNVTNETGLSAQMAGWVNPSSIDLVAGITISEPMINPFPDSRAVTAGLSVRTNLQVGFRLRVPKGKSVFLMQDSAGTNDPKPTVILLEATTKP